MSDVYDEMYRGGPPRRMPPRPRYADPVPPPQPARAPVPAYTQQLPAHGHAAARPHRQPGLTTAGVFWYVLGNIAFGAMYLCKVPVKKALADAGLGVMTGAEKFWYVLECIAFGGGYLAKLPIAKAISEVQQHASYR